jgi:hypothetical protein
VGKRNRDALHRWLDRALLLPYDRHVATVWGELPAGGVRRGRPRPVSDSWVAACCRVEAGYFGETFGRPFDEPPPWFEDDAEPNADMCATAEQSREQIVELCHCEQSRWLRPGWAAAPARRTGRRPLHKARRSSCAARSAGTYIETAVVVDTSGVQPGTGAGRCGGAGRPSGGRPLRLAAGAQHAAVHHPQRRETRLNLAAGAQLRDRLQVSRQRVRDLTARFPGAVVWPVGAPPGRTAAASRAVCVVRSLLARAG